MMKKFFYLSAILAIVLVSCNSEKEYIAKLSNTASMIEKEADLSEAIALHYCDTWRKVIYDHEYNGEYCTDFNEAFPKSAKEGEANYSGSKEGSGQPAIVYAANVDLSSGEKSFEANLVGHSSPNGSSGEVSKDTSELTTALQIVKRITVIIQ